MVSPQQAKKSPSLLTVTQVHAVPNVQVHKVLSGAGDEISLCSYNASCEREALENGVHGRVPVERLDWRAIYTQFTRSHVLGTVPYRWEAHLEAMLVTVTFESPLDIVVIGGSLMSNTGTCGAEKAKAIKGNLGVDQTRPLMHTLGAQGKVALVKETDTEWELVLPHNLLSGKDGLRYSERRVAIFKRGADMPVTQSWCPWPQSTGSALHWHRWVEGNEPICIPDLAFPRISDEVAI